MKISFAVHEKSSLLSSDMEIAEIKAPPAVRFSYGIM
jgi:hypothetical protein